MFRYIDVIILHVYMPSKIVLAGEFRSSDICDFLPFGKSFSKNFWNPEPAPRHPAVGDENPTVDPGTAAVSRRRRR